jgi:geranylgeranyl pyrophosphate synthase
MDFVKSMGGIDYSIERAMQFSDRARADLAAVPDSDSKKALLEFVDFVMARNS